MVPMGENTESMDREVAEQQSSDDPHQTSGSTSTAQNVTTTRYKTVHRRSTSAVLWNLYVLFDLISHMIQLYV
jgi:hypothetical protein